MDPLLNYHPIAVHFPIAFLLLAFLFQCIAWLSPGEIWERAVLITVFLGTAGALLAGLLLHPHASPNTLPEEAVHAFEEHELYAELTQWSSSIALLLKVLELLIRNSYTRTLKLASTLFLAISCTTVFIAGHYGGYLVYEHEVGVKGKNLRKEKKQDR